jgi:hypothetical protein
LFAGVLIIVLIIPGVLFLLHALGRFAVSDP